LLSSAIDGLHGSGAIESAILFLKELAVLLLLSLLLLTLLLSLDLLLLAHLDLPLSHLRLLTSKYKDSTALDLFGVCVRDTLSLGLVVELGVVLAM
jgi:hypothetical protein